MQRGIVIDIGSDKSGISMISRNVVDLSKPIVVEFMDTVTLFTPSLDELTKHQKKYEYEQSLIKQKQITSQGTQPHDMLTEQHVLKLHMLEEYYTYNVDHDIIDIFQQQEKQKKTFLTTRRKEPIAWQKYHEQKTRHRQNKNVNDNNNNNNKKNSTIGGNDVYYSYLDFTFEDDEDDYKDLYEEDQKAYEIDSDSDTETGIETEDGDENRMDDNNRQTPNFQQQREEQINMSLFQQITQNSIPTTCIESEKMEKKLIKFNRIIYNFSIFMEYLIKLASVYSETIYHVKHHHHNNNENKNNNKQRPIDWIILEDNFSGFSNQNNAIQHLLYGFLTQYFLKRSDEYEMPKIIFKNGMYKMALRWIIGRTQNNTVVETSRATTSSSSLETIGKKTNLTENIVQQQQQLFRPQTQSELDFGDFYSKTWLTINKYNVREIIEDRIEKNTKLFYYQPLVNEPRLVLLVKGGIKIPHKKSSTNNTNAIRIENKKFVTFHISSIIENCKHIVAAQKWLFTKFFTNSVESDKWDVADSLAHGLCYIFHNMIYLNNMKILRPNLLHTFKLQRFPPYKFLSSTTTTKKKKPNQKKKKDKPIDTPTNNTNSTTTNQNNNQHNNTITLEDEFAMDQISSPTPSSLSSSCLTQKNVLLSSPQPTKPLTSSSFSFLQQQQPKHSNATPTTSISKEKKTTVTTPTKQQKSSPTFIFPKLDITYFPSTTTKKPPTIIPMSPFISSLRTNTSFSPKALVPKPRILQYPTNQTLQPTTLPSSTTLHTNTTTQNYSLSDEFDDFERQFTPFKPTISSIPTTTPTLISTTQQLQQTTTNNTNMQLEPTPTSNVHSNNTITCQKTNSSMETQQTPIIVIDDIVDDDNDDFAEKKKNNNNNTQIKTFSTSSSTLPPSTSSHYPQSPAMISFKDFRLLYTPPLIAKSSSSSSSSSTLNKPKPKYTFFDPKNRKKMCIINAKNKKK